MVYTFEMVYIVDMVYTVDKVFTVDMVTLWLSTLSYFDNLGHQELENIAHEGEESL